MKRPKKREKPNLKHNFLAKDNKREEITPQLNLTYVRLSKKHVGKIDDFGLQFSFKLDL